MSFIEIQMRFHEGQAVIPNCVNCLAVNRTIVLPDPKGPTIDGIDASAAPMRATLESLRLTVYLIENWEFYHARAGEVHCGINAMRRVKTLSWWETDPALSKRPWRWSALPIPAAQKSRCALKTVTAIILLPSKSPPW